MQTLLRTRKSVILFILAASLTLVSVAGFIHAANYHYVFMGVFALILLFQSKLRVTIGQVWIIPFLLACVISLIINDPPDLFNAWNRLYIYIVTLVIVSPLFVNRKIGVIRATVLYYILIVCTLLSVGSFIAYFLDINLFDRGDGYLEISAGNFSGLMNHSIVLGHFSGLSSAFVFSYLLAYKNNQLKKTLLFVTLLLCLGACFLSASRNGILSCFVSIAVALFSYYRKRLSKGIMVGLSIIVVAAALFPFWGGITDFLLEKNQGNIDLGGSLVYSRTFKFDARIQEFKSSPIFGIGYSTVDPTLDTVNLQNGQIEPGSSWLAVASMTGIIGLIPFIIICASAFRKAWRDENLMLSTLLLSLLSFYYVHMISEGYIFAPRSFLGLVFWLILSTVYQEDGK